jgi:membrane associated rhomboid family serine protease
MLEDRYYMRRPAFKFRWSATIVLLVVNVIAFIIQNVLYRFPNIPTDEWFALSVDGLRRGFVWQLLTYQFMHGGVLHLLLNCWALFVFGGKWRRPWAGISFWLSTSAAA